jgi:hypothetical protein
MSPDTTFHLKVAWFWANGARQNNEKWEKRKEKMEKRK